MSIEEIIAMKLWTANGFYNDIILARTMAKKIIALIPLITLEIACQECGGMGSISAMGVGFESALISCETCNGTGRQSIRIADAQGMTGIVRFG